MRRTGHAYFRTMRMLARPDVRPPRAASCSLTASADFCKASNSAAFNRSSRMRSTPLAPSTAGTPMNKYRMPYSPWSEGRRLSRARPRKLLACRVPIKADHASALRPLKMLVPDAEIPPAALGAPSVRRHVQLKLAVAIVAGLIPGAAPVPPVKERGLYRHLLPFVRPVSQRIHPQWNDDAVLLDLPFTGEIEQAETRAISIGMSIGRLCAQRCGGAAVQNEREHAEADGAPCLSSVDHKSSVADLRPVISIRSARYVNMRVPSEAAFIQAVVCAKNA
jgi:hypothetical protein